MRILLFTDDPRLASRFDAWKKPGPKARKVSFELFPRERFEKRIKALIEEERGAGELYLYFDISGLDARDLKGLAQKLGKLGLSGWTAVDVKGGCLDPALLFHGGAADYLGPKAPEEAWLPARIRCAVEYANRFAAGEAASEGGASVPEPGEAQAVFGQKGKRAVPVVGKARPEDWKSSAAQWSKLQEGEIYTFVFLYLQLDDGEKLHERVGDQRFAVLQRGLRAELDRLAATCCGVTWIWRTGVGLALIPFDLERCPLLFEAIKFHLNLCVTCARNPDLRELQFSLRTAIHIGNIDYRTPGKTGTVVSDSLNSIFHLGSKYAREGTLSLTENVKPFIPAQLRDLFDDAGEFEGRKIYSLKKIV